MSDLPALPEGALRGQRALITGASRGIGRAFATELAKAGAHVILLARTVGALEALDDELAAYKVERTLVPLDLNDQAGIARLGASVMERWGGLDMLIGNAGALGTLTPLALMTESDWNEVWSINLMANWNLIRALETPLLKASGRAIFLSSSVATGGRAFWGPYAASKAALEVMVASWADEMKARGIKANLVDPGGTATAMRKSAFPGEDASKLRSPEQVAQSCLPLLSPEIAVTGHLLGYRTQTLRPVGA